MKSQNKLSTDLLFACASYAMRINGGYCKEAEYGNFDSYTGEGAQITRQTNKLVLLGALENQSVLTEADYEHGRSTRQFCQGLVFNQLKHGNLSEFHTKILNCASEEEATPRDAGIVAYAPVMFDQHLRRQAVVDVLAECDRSYLGIIGATVTATVKVVRSSYSERYGCNFITAITDNNQAVFFSYKTALEVNQKYSLKGKVKGRSPDFQTNLNYVKI